LKSNCFFWRNDFAGILSFAAVFPQPCSIPVKTPPLTIVLTSGSTASPAQVAFGSTPGSVCTPKIIATDPVASPVT
jgi:hypothetical protein